MVQHISKNITFKNDPSKSVESVTFCIGYDGDTENYEHDDEIFFYCDTMEDLEKLVGEKSTEDFYIVEDKKDIYVLSVTDYLEGENHVVVCRSFEDAKRIAEHDAKCYAYGCGLNEDSISRTEDKNCGSLFYSIEDYDSEVHKTWEVSNFKTAF